VVEFTLENVEKVMVLKAREGRRHPTVKPDSISIAGLANIKLPERKRKPESSRSGERREGSAAAVTQAGNGSSPLWLFLLYVSQGIRYWRHSRISYSDGKRSKGKQSFSKAENDPLLALRKKVASKRKSLSSSPTTQIGRKRSPSLKSGGGRRKRAKQ